jgi:hypothetical protein
MSDSTAVDDVQVREPVNIADHLVLSENTFYICEERAEVTV